MTSEFRDESTPHNSTDSFLNSRRVSRRVSRIRTAAAAAEALASMETHGSVDAVQTAESSSTPQRSSLLTACGVHKQQTNGDSCSDGDDNMHNQQQQQQQQQLSNTYQYQHCYDYHASASDKPEGDDSEPPSKLSRFFHSLSNRLKFGRGSGVDSREALLRELGFGLDFAAVIQQPPLHLLDDGAACMQRLGRVRKVFVLTKDEVVGVGTVVRIEVTLAPPTPLTTVAVSQSIFRPNTTSTTFVLARPFEECRKLRKAILFLVGRERQRQHERHERHEQRSRSVSVAAETPTSNVLDARPSVGGQLMARTTLPACPFCSRVARYAQWCWEQPPLLATNVMSGLALFKKIVLTNSLNGFLDMARSPHDVATLGTSAASGASGAQQQQQQASTLTSSSAPVPFCEVQAEFAILLHDFFQLHQHMQ